MNAETQAIVEEPSPPTPAVKDTPPSPSLQRKISMLIQKVQKNHAFFSFQYQKKCSQLLLLLEHFPSFKPSEAEERLKKLKDTVEIMNKYLDNVTIMSQSQETLSQSSIEELSREFESELENNQKAKWHPDKIQQLLEESVTPDALQKLFITHLQTLDQLINSCPRSTLKENFHQIYTNLEYIPLYGQEERRNLEEVLDYISHKAIELNQSVKQQENSDLSFHAKRLDGFTQQVITSISLQKNYVLSFAPQSEWIPIPEKSSYKTILHQAQQPSPAPLNESESPGLFGSIKSQDKDTTLLKIYSGNATNQYRKNVMNGMVWLENIDQDSQQLRSDVVSLSDSLQPAILFEQILKKNSEYTLEKLDKARFENMLSKLRDDRKPITEENLREYLSKESPANKKQVNQLAKQLFVAYSESMTQTFKPNPFTTEVFPCEALLELALRQLLNYKSLTQAESIVITHAYDIQYLRALSLFAQALGVSLINQSKYQDRQHPLYQVNLFRGNLPRTKPRIKHFESFLEKKLQGSTLHSLYAQAKHKYVPKPPSLSEQANSFNPMAWRSAK